MLTINTTPAQVLRVKQGKPFTGRINDADYRVLCRFLTPDYLNTQPGTISYVPIGIRFMSTSTNGSKTYCDAMLLLQYIRTFTKKQGWYWRRKASVL